MEIAFIADDEVRAAIARIGQTEDVQFSPDGRRLALAGLIRNRILVLECAAGFRTASGPIALTGFLELDSASLKSPHGLAWIDDEALAVANRDARVTIFALARGGGSGRLRLRPVRSLGADQRDLLATPGSVSAAPIGLGLVELLICNNCLHHVSRHLLDQRDGYAVVASEILIEQGLDLPDGVAHSPSGRWIAVSNHNHHCVFVFRNEAGLSGASKPQAVLRGIDYPHGLSFAGDDMSLLVADAAAPFVHHFSSGGGDWTGERAPSASIRVMDDDVFERGRHNPGEGGPKGVDATRDGGLMVTTCEERPLAFFDVSALRVRPAALPDARSEAAEADAVRAALLRSLAAIRAETAEPAEATTRLREEEIHKLINSRSFRLTAPLRRIAATLRRPARRSRARRARPVPPSA
jgi:hypothetical protein